MKGLYVLGAMIVMWAMIYFGVAHNRQFATESVNQFRAGELDGREEYVKDTVINQDTLEVIRTYRVDIHYRTK